MIIIGQGLEKSKNQGHHPWGNSEEQIMKGVALGQDAEGSMMGTVHIEAAHSGMCVQDAIAIA